MARRRRSKNRDIPKALLLVCIITGIGTILLRMVNRRVEIPELGEIAGYTGTAFAISFIIIVTIYIVKLVNKN